MKNIITQIAALLITCMPLGGIHVQGQTKADNQVNVTQGEKGKFLLFEGAGGIRSTSISGDARYISGAVFDEDFGFIYDVQKDTFMISLSAEFIVSPDLYMGNGKIVDKGEVIELKSRYNGPLQDYDLVSIWAITPDGEKIIGMAYEETIDPQTGESIAPNYSYIFNKQGKIIERIEPKWPMTTDPKFNNAGYGERVNGVNSDGTILAGHSSNPETGSGWSPVFWDLTNDTAYGIGNEKLPAGSLEGTNNDGSIIFGSALGASTIIRYDRANKTYTTEQIPSSPGKTHGLVPGMSETGLVLFNQQASGMDMGSREAYLYDLNTKEVVNLNEYIEELYGISVSIPIFSANQISDDARTIAGFTYKDGGWFPFAIILDETQIFAKARKLSAIQYRGELKVALQWSAPLKGQYNLKGFNIYCDSVKINTQLVDKNALEYEHVEGLEAGIHLYEVEAVYEEGIAQRCKSSQIYVVGTEGCFPVQEMGSEVVYNRTVNLHWGLPSSQIVQGKKSSVFVDRSDYPLEKGRSDGSGQELAATKLYSNENLDLIKVDNTNTSSASCGIQIGDKVYVSDYSYGLISIYKASDFELLSTHTIEGVGSIYSMVQIGDKIYCGGKGEISIVDIATMTLSNRLKTKAGETIHHLSFIQTMDNGKGGFIYGDWETIHYCNKYGIDIEPESTIDVKGLIMSGSAYCDGKYYVFSQTGSNLSEIYTFDFSNGKLIKKQDLANITRLNDVSSYGFMAGGMSSFMLQDSTMVLGTILQYAGTYNHLAYLEVKGAPSLLGYNLYRNGQKVNPDGEYIKGLTYSEQIVEPGKYVYTVEAVNVNDCSSKLDNVNTTVDIMPIGECKPPVVSNVYESNSSAVLSWDIAANENASLVGFNIYKNGEQIEEHLLSLNYIDSDLPLGKFTYRIEAFYDNSCISSDSAQIVISKEGKLMPPTTILLSNKKAEDETFDISAQWELPFFETPLAIGYSNLPFSGTGLSEGEPIYVAIGWDSSQLAKYKDLYLVGMEYFIGEKIVDIDGLLYLNDTLAYSQKMKKKVVENDWNRIMFDKHFSMNQPMEVVVGYKATYSDKTKPVAVYDMGPAVEGYGDLMSVDGQQWTTLSSQGINSNWCINALVVKKRDLEGLKKGMPLRSGNPIVKTMTLDVLELGSTQKIESRKTNKATSGIKLLGFNVYRDEAKVNTDVITDMRYTDKGMARDIYDYQIAAIYDGDQELLSEVVTIDLTGLSVGDVNVEADFIVYPNPAKISFAVKGEYVSMEIINISGKTISRYENSSSIIDISGIPSGVYMLKFYLNEGKSVVKKLVVE